MFTTCFHCCGKLGTNELIEHFPVGDRLAFDADRGRLWVVCPHCSRWNLTPLEERWEAVEECERQFRAVRLRAQTANIGYAKAGDGVGLVRIGKPLRPEFAAWRYGREFSRRRTRYLVALGSGGLLAAGVLAGSVAIGSVSILPMLSVVLYRAYQASTAPEREVDIPRGPGRSWMVSMDSSAILPDADERWKLHVRHHFGSVDYRGDEARRFLAVLLARVNDTGAGEGLIRDAIGVVEQEPTTQMLTSIAERSEMFWERDKEKQRAWDVESFSRESIDRPQNRGSLAHITLVDRLALEMSLHESSEQKAIDGDLVELEAAWREAEEVAGIADNLLLPPGVEEFIAEEKRKKRKRS